jgi:hypothetical protein
LEVLGIREMVAMLYELVPKNWTRGVGAF